MTTTTEARRVRIEVANGYGCREKLRDFRFAFNEATKTWSREATLLDGKFYSDDMSTMWSSEASFRHALSCYDKSRKHSVTIVDVA